MKSLRVSRLVCLLISLLCEQVQLRAETKSSEDLCAVSSSALGSASDIRGLAVKKSVPCVTQDKTQVREFLEETIRTELPPEKMEMEQLAYRAIGMIPDDYEYGKNLVRLLVSELGGYYDPKAGRFVMAAWLPASVQETVAVHELTHALQDQHFNLRKFIDARSDNGDKSLAYSAVIEGDATAVMLDNDRRLKGMQKIASDQNIESTILVQILGMNIGGSEGEVPPSLKAMLIFPYTSGLRFAHTMLRSKGYAGLDSIYQRPPQSTREILHPEDYLSGSFIPEIPTDAELGAIDEQPIANRRVEYADTIGEFGIAGLLSNSTTQNETRTRASTGWKGDRLVVYSPSDDQRIVRWLSRWESEQDAQEFHAAYSSFLQERYKTEIGVSEVRLSTTKRVEMGIKGRDVLIQFRIMS